MDSEKMAYLVTAYKDPLHLSRLIKSLNEKSDFYIHIDAKVSMAPFKTVLSDFENVRFTRNRFFTNWGGYRHFLCHYELLRRVIESKEQYLRVVCLSGLDYPVWSNLRIRHTFETHRNWEYISGFNITRGHSRRQLKRIRMYHFLYDVKVKDVLMKKVFSGLARKVMQTLPVRRNPFTELDGNRADVFMGSDYWAITIGCAKYVFEKMSTQKRLMKYFKYTFVPSEMCVQTIVFNSPFASNAIVYNAKEYPGLTRLTPLHYIEYGKAIRIFTERDYNLLVNSGKMFFRKASSGISNVLLDKIDSRRASCSGGNHQSS